MLVFVELTRSLLCNNSLVMCQRWRELSVAGCRIQPVCDVIRLMILLVARYAVL